MSDATILAFWHRTQRVCKPWTFGELRRRTKLDDDALESALRSLAKRGLARAPQTTNRNDDTIWELTEAGKVQARAILAAEAIARSV